jgi:hypothetical protein
VYLRIPQARLEEGAGLSGVHVRDLHQRQQVLTHARRRHLR